MLFLIAENATAQVVSPKHEVRAVWITTAYGLDWPCTRATSPASMRRQQEELVAILDRLQAAHFNTVLFQTRTRGDVFYRSEIEPMSAILTGCVGQDPGYDPLAFAIEECHKRGMECHAWMVAIPLGSRKHVAQLGTQSVTRRNRNICLTYNKEHFLNPGHPETKTYLMSMVKEVVSRYDVDGVHFDYLRYPENAPRFPDTDFFRKYGRGRSLAQWRRDNLSEIVRYIYKGVKTLKPWVKVSTSPVGKYDDTTRYPSRGWNAYHTVFQDVQGWIAEGIQDQIYPMMYFRGNHFYPFALDWQEQSCGRQVIPGLGIYFLDPTEGSWQIDEVERQLLFCRQQGLAGTAHYRMKYLMEDTQGLYTTLCQDYYTTPALQPAMPWLDTVKPTPPQDLKVEESEKGIRKLSWQAATDNDEQNAPSYVIYASDHYPVDTSRPENIIAQRVKDTAFVYTPILPWETKRFFAVSAVDRYGNESEAAQAEGF